MQIRVAKTEKNHKLMGKGENLMTRQHCGKQDQKFYSRSKPDENIKSRKRYFDPLNK
jgi:hypothetical protein